MVLKMPAACLLHLAEDVATLPAMALGYLEVLIGGAMCRHSWRAHDELLTKRLGQDNRCRSCYIQQENMNLQAQLSPPHNAGGPALCWWQP